MNEESGVYTRDILKGLNESQLKAVISESRSCLVLAGPGSGKTHTITARIRYLIHNRGVPPEKILVITFTKDAAVSMQRRFNGSETGICPVIFGTFHSVFYQILRKNKGYSTQKLLSDSYKKRIFSKIISDIIPAKNSCNEKINSGEIAPEFINAVSIYKNTLDDKRARSAIKKDLSKYFDDVFKAYEKKRKKDGFIDFDDMVYDLMNDFKENEDVLSNWRRRFEHILIDEYQDINEVQYETVKLLAGKRSCVFAVGDDDQSIYGFRGSEPECLRRFKNENNAEQIFLNLNYRSNSDIVEISKSVIKENKDRFDKDPQSALSDEPSTEHFKLISFEDNDKENEYIKEIIIKSSKKVGILFRTNLLMQRFAAYLKSQSVPFEMKEKQMCIYDHAAVTDILAYMMIADEMNEEKLYRIINKPLRFVSRESLSGNGNPIDNAIRYYSVHKEEYQAAARVKSLLEMKRDLNFIKGKMPFLQVRYIRSRIGLEAYYRMNFKNNKKLLEEYIAVLDFLSEDASKYTSVEDWTDFMEEYRKDFKECKVKKHEITENLPELMTVHASKGLEFDTVIIPQANEGVYPHGKMSETKETEEERRIFYVAMTRAKDKLIITYVSGSKDSPRSPSRFLNPIIQRN